MIGQSLISTETESVGGLLTLLYRDPARTITVSLRLFADEGDTCHITGTAAVAE